MNNIALRKVTLDNIHQLQVISRQTFFETFSTGNTEENMNKYLEEELSVEKLTAELRDSNSQFYFATINDKIVGYLKLNTGQAQTELKDDRALEIERIYALKEYHGKGVGQALYEHAIQMARQMNADYV
ncbi:GNAT family N-acetyltransferase [uncultured Pontibacter sp.]|uniref:GNAT family N-acetyltransferase n=1 Tax=uncultured Pontibacter sp. TaxID=453356 RepID=UPI00261BE73B|nr:GNAT family N-acetyltransferase [uncultured Pontibacter sp.]